MNSRKRALPSDENTVPFPATTDTNFEHYDPNAPKTKRARRVAQQISPRKVEAIRAARTAADALQAKERAAEDESRRQVESTACLAKALEGIAGAGFSTLSSFLTTLMRTKDAHQSSQVSQMLIHHGKELLDSMRARQPVVVGSWAAEATGEAVALEATKLAEYFTPKRKTSVSHTLDTFSLERMLADAETIAPVLCKLLRCMGKTEGSESTSRKHVDIVLITVISMLARTHNENASEFQTTMAIYLLACGATRSQFDVLNHAGFSLSYSSAVGKIKTLSKERLGELVQLARVRAFMIIWDNLNISFRVGEQRADSKDHFDNGCTATLIPVFGVEFGGLPLSLKSTRDSRLPYLDWDEADLLPSLKQVRQIEEAQLWHIEDILFDAFPAHRARLAGRIPPVPNVLPIPLHKTEQYPLPAMHIDESSLEGTLKVLRAILCDSLKLTGDVLEKHGVVFCAGDQLTISLLDKASATRRDDTDLVDNVGRYTEGQLGLFHVKMAGARMVANEFWGKANSKSPWSLWKINSLLGRKAISAGWKAKALPPFRPVYELVLNMTLPAHILDAFRIHCPCDSLEDWLVSSPSHDQIRGVAKKILTDHCSARRVSHLRSLPPAKRDVILENIILFNRDALILRILKQAVRQGDIGGVLNVLAYWMVMFRGTGKMPKYADALFHVIVTLKHMDPKLRKAFLMNWLANLSGTKDGWKEMDLLQEHQNFWAKVIYNARGSNRSWEWLAMVSVVIFTLRDVIRQVQTEFKVPYNGTSHSSPSSSDDITNLRGYLERLELQQYRPTRKGNEYATPARDLFSTGVEYANKPSAFKTFTRAHRAATNKGVRAQVPPSSVPDCESDDEDEDASAQPVDHDLQVHPGVEPDDLDMDEEEFPGGLADFVEMARELIDELNKD